jgi:beta-exotoxin I transport system permease protein
MSVTASTRQPAAGRQDVALPAPWRSLGVVVRHLLWSNRRTPLTWGGGLGAMSALIAAMWPSIEGSVAKLMREYPPALKDAFGIDELDSLAAYVSAEMLSLIVPLAVVFLTVRCVVGATSAAEERGHLDVLLTLPLSRRVLVAGAVIAAATLSAAVLAIAWGMTCVAGAVVGATVDVGPLLAGFADVWPLAMAFAGLGMLATGLTSRSAVATGVAVGTAVAMYVLDLVGKVSDTLEPLRNLSAFRLYGTAVRDGLSVSHVLALVGVGLALAVAGAVLFDRRDLG